jgi:hypothetical protein
VNAQTVENIVGPMADDIERKAKNAKWAASEMYDVLGLFDRHKGHVRDLWNRYKDEPQFQERIKELALNSRIQQILDLK